MINGIKIEICIGNIDDAIVASKYPIDRIELNTALELGGLSPSIETIKTLKKTIDTPLCCMCRPRGGDFLYSDLEYETMLKDAEMMLEAGADGIVFGFLDQDNKADIPRTQRMAELIHLYRKEAIFHKAFDEIKDQDEAIRQLIDCKTDRILTGGGTAYPGIVEGCRNIRILNDKYRDSIQLLPGGGVRVSNIKDVITISGSGQVHMTSKKQNPGGYVCLDEEQLQEMLKEISSL